MSPSAAPSPASHDRSPGGEPGGDLSVSLFDRVSSGLITALILVGVLVAGLLIVFFSLRLYEPPKSVAVAITSYAEGPGGAGLGQGLELNAAVGDFSTSVQSVPALSALDMVADAVRDSAARLDRVEQSGPDLGERGGQRGGDGRTAGEGGELFGRPHRWDIRFAGGSLREYAAQLDYLGIELGVVGDDDRVHYVYDLRQSPPRRRSGSPKAESRLRMTWQSGGLQEADRELMRRAGVTVSGPIMQFFPAKTEALLADLESRSAGARPIGTIQQTVFGVRRAAAGEEGYEFYVIEQRFY